jgi:hypothetical protein
VLRVCGACAVLVLLHAVAVARNFKQSL